VKRHGNLFKKICDLENIMLAHENARKGKAHYREVKLVNLDPKAFCSEIKRLLESKKFSTSDYIIEQKHDGRKMRTIYKLPYYPDRIIQHALIQVCGPIWQKQFIRDTFQSIVGRGTHDARKRVEKAISNSSPKYALKFDIKKYYPSIDNEKLKKIVRKKIKCKDTLWLIDNIIDSSQGIPIGNYTSQYFGNMYLNEFDWWAKQTLKLKNYYRYCDDIVVLCDTASECHEVRRAMFEKLRSEFSLEIKSNWQVFPVEVRGLDFVGYVFKQNSTRLRKNIATGFKAKARSIKKRPLSQHQAIGGLMSYWGWIKHANAKKLWLSEVDDTIIRITNDYGTKRNPIKEIMQ